MQLVQIAPHTPKPGTIDDPAPTRTPSGVEVTVRATPAATILLVDGLELNRQVFRGILRKEPYRILEVQTPSAALRLLEAENIDLVVAELLMPEMSGFDFCRRMKACPRTRLIPLLILTSMEGIEGEVAGLESGADDYLVRPLRPSTVRTRVRAMIRNKRAVDSLEEAEAILYTLAHTVESRDRETGNHCERLAVLSVRLGTVLGLPESDLKSLQRGGYLHDIGKISVPDAILLKNGKLTEAEWDVMRGHTVSGEELCRPMRTLAPVLPIIRSHHERWDGSGYPDGLAGEGIPLLARILQLADIYDALTSVRPYKPAYSSEEALRILEEEAARGWRDRELVGIFASVIKKGGISEAWQRAQSQECVDSPAASDLESLRRSLEQIREAGRVRAN